MLITFELNGKKISREIAPDKLLLDLLRDEGCYSVKRGCDTTNCGLCTVIVDDKSILSCGYLAARVDGKCVETLENFKNKMEELGGYIAREGAEQCGFCNPGYLMNLIALERENPTPTDEEIKEYLIGNLCRCSGYESQLRGFRKYFDSKKEA